MTKRNIIDTDRKVRALTSEEVNLFETGYEVGVLDTERDTENEIKDLKLELKATKTLLLNATRDVETLKQLIKAKGR